MDVGFYLGELLMQQGEVSVPGLGYFVQVRMGGYYDERQGKFFPPYHKAQFDQQTIDDEDLVQYIARKKNISVTSAKYFSEKYITNLKQAALTGEVAIGNLGWFRTEQSRLTFKPADKLTNDNSFYGYQPVSIKKLGEHHHHVVTEPVIAEPVIIHIPEEKPVEKLMEAEYERPPILYTENDYLEEENNNTNRNWLIATIVAVLLVISVFAIYFFAPATFDKLLFWKQNTTAATILVKPKITAQPKADSTNTDSVKKDTAKIATVDTVKKITPIATALPADTIKDPRFEVIAANCRDTAAANKIIKKLKAKGLNAKVVTDGPPSRYIMISVGTYKSFTQAKNDAVNLINAGKISTDVYPVEIKPKQ